MPDEKDPSQKPSTTAKDAPVDAPVPPSTALEEAEQALAGSMVGSSTADDDESSQEEEDSARPEAILRRVEALGEVDELEKLARDEEAKLAERRRAQKKGKKKSGLEAAASKRLAKIGGKSPVKRPIATAVDADPILDRMAQLGDWAKKNQKAVGIVAAVAAVGVGAFGINLFLQHRRDAEASVVLGKAVADDCVGYPDRCIGDPAKEESPDHAQPPRVLFKTADDRREAALREYREVEKRFGGTGAAILARLSEGSLLLDKHDIQGAMQAFTDVNQSLLAKADTEVRGRSLEGLGFAYELKAQDQQGDAKTATLDEALKAFRELENTDVEGFKELGMYHQARVDEAKGDLEKAVELLKALHERLSKPGETKSHPFPYLQSVADDRLRALDPSALPPKQQAGQFGGGAGNQLTEAQRRMIMEQLQQRRAQPPGSPPPGKDEGK